MKAPEGLPRLKALVTNWLGWAPRAGLPGGCPVAAGMFRVPTTSTARCATEIAEMEAPWRGLLTALVTQAVDCGHFRRGLDVDQFVWELCGIYLSHHVASRFLKSPDADRRASTAFAALAARARVVKGANERDVAPGAAAFLTPQASAHRGLEDPADGLGDRRDDDAGIWSRGLDDVRIGRPACPHETTSCPQQRRRAHVVRGIADHEGLRHIDAVLTGGALYKSLFGFLHGQGSANR